MPRFRTACRRARRRIGNRIQRIGSRIAGPYEVTITFDNSSIPDAVLSAFIEAKGIKEAERAIEERRLALAEEQALQVAAAERETARRLAAD